MSYALALNTPLTLIGQLACNPEEHATTDGTRKFVVLTLAVKQRYQDRQTKQWQEKTITFSVLVNGPKAKYVIANAKQGQTLVVTAKLQSRENETNGKKYFNLSLSASDVQIVPGAQKAPERTVQADDGYGDAEDSYSPF